MYIFLNLYHSVIKVINGFRMAYGNEVGIVIVDIEQKVCLLNVGSPDLYGAQDPYSRVPRSPKKNQNVNESLPINMDKDERQPRSPSIDQVSSYKCFPKDCMTEVEIKIIN